MRVLAAMSGGVDSAVAAARAVDAGHDVTGVHLALSRNPATLRTGARGCCTVEDANDARRAADVLGIPFYVWDLAERFRADVIDDFVAEYAAGRTPNPCLRCNEKIKFAAVLDRALALGFDAVVTGHHARLDRRRAAPLGRRRPRTSPTCSAVLTPRPAGARDVPARRLDQGRGARRGRRARPGRRRQARLARHLLHRRRRHPRLPGRAGSARSAGDDRRRRDRRRARHARRRVRLHRRPAARAAPDRPAPDGEPRYVLVIQPDDNTVVVGRGELLDVDEVTAARAGVDRRRPRRASRSSARCSCARTA